MNRLEGTRKEDSKTHFRYERNIEGGKGYSVVVVNPGVEFGRRFKVCRDNSNMYIRLFVRKRKKFIANHFAACVEETDREAWDDSSGSTSNETSGVVGEDEGSSFNLIDEVGVNLIP